MSSSCIAAQLYTLRSQLRTPEEIAVTLPQVAKLGYRAVQLSALGPIETLELKKILDAEGLEVCATHVSWERLLTDLDGVVEEHELLGCSYVAVGSMPAEYRNVEGYARFAREASRVGARMKERGLTFGYHNHSFEFERVGATTGMEVLLAESDAKSLAAEIDTYWVQHGGGDPAAWIRRCTGRIPAVHLKDMVIVGKEQQMAEVGEGNLNWPSILEACRDAGVRWYIVEQDQTYDRSPLESLGISLRNLKAMGLS